MREIFERELEHVKAQEKQLERTVERVIREHRHKGTQEKDTHEKDANKNDHAAKGADQALSKENGGLQQEAQKSRPVQKALMTARGIGALATHRVHSLKNLFDRGR